MRGKFPPDTLRWLKNFITEVAKIKIRQSNIKILDYLIVEERIHGVGLPSRVLVHVNAPEVVADGEEEGQVVSGNHQHRQHVQQGECPSSV